MVHLWHNIGGRETCKKLLVSWYMYLQFFGIQGYSPVSECDFCSVSIKLNLFFSSFTGWSIQCKV